MLRVTWRPHHSQATPPWGAVGEGKPGYISFSGAGGLDLLCWGSVSDLFCGIWRRLRSSLLGIASIAAD